MGRGAHDQAVGGLAGNRECDLVPRLGRRLFHDGRIDDGRRRLHPPMNALEYASDLVAFPSISSRSNADVSDYVEKVLKRLEFDTERIEYTDAAGVKKVNVVGKKGPGKGGLAYFGHTDV